MVTGTGHRSGKIGGVTRDSFFWVNPKPLQKLSIIPPVQDLQIHRRIELPQPSDLSILLRHEVLLEGREFDEEVELGEIEIGGEALGHFAAAVPLQGKALRLVLPLDLVEVQNAGKFGLARVGKGGPRLGGLHLEGRILFGPVEDLLKPIEEGNGDLEPFLPWDPFPFMRLPEELNVDPPVGEEDADWSWKGRRGGGQKQRLP